MAKRKSATRRTATRTRKSATRKTTTRTRKVLPQTGVRKSLKQDRKLKAKPPGVRYRGTKYAYTETRRNRSDTKGSRT